MKECQASTHKIPVNSAKGLGLALCILEGPTSYTDPGMGRQHVILFSS